MTFEIKTALIDADCCTYVASASAQRDYGTEIWGNIKHAIEDAEAQILKEMDQAGCNQVLLVYSPRDGSNFRKTILPTYKYNRKATPKPILYGELRVELEKRYDHISIDSLEGDDVLGLLAEKIPNSVIVSIDKDLYTIPDTEYLRPNTMAFPAYTSRDYADYFWLTQTLTGDAVDNYKGLHGCGPKSAKVILDPYMEVGIDDNGQATHSFDFDGAWEAVKDAYRAKGKTDWLVQAQCARILRHGDYDSVNKRVKLFNPDNDNDWLQLPIKD